MVASVLPGVGPITRVASVDTFCGKADVVLTADSISYPPVIYEWSRRFSGSESYAPQTSGRVLKISNLSHSDTIWVTCTTMAGGCTSNKPNAILTQLKNSPPPLVSLSDTLICPGKSTYLFVNGSPTEKVKLYSDSLMNHIDTTFNIGQPFKTPDLYHDKTYWISHSLVAKECRPVPAKISIRIKTLPELVLPNLVTINGDGKNDFFEVKELPHGYPIELRIFNRWGKEVYYSSAYENYWQGRAGTYFYLLRTGAKQYKGWLEVVK